MSEKSDLYQMVKSSGYEFEKAYVNYTVDELKTIAKQVFKAQQDALIDDPDQAALALAADIIEESTNVDEFEAFEAPEAPPVAQVAPESAPEPRWIRRPPRPAAWPSAAPVRPASQAPLQAPPATPLQALQAAVATVAQRGQLVEGASFNWPGGVKIPVQNKGAERAGLTHSIPDGQPIRIDTRGRIWFRDEVQKPAIPKPRMTRTTRTTSPGVKEERTYLPDGHLDEIYEVAGDENRELLVKTTLPSWQVGKYLDPRFPFAIHTYNGVSGFDFVEVRNYYGGLDLVPRSIKTVYVGNQLCYQIATTRETIQTQFNALTRGR